MKSFEEPLKKSALFEEINEALKEKGITEIEGCVDAAKPNLMSALGRDKRFRIIVTADELKARALYSDYRVYDSDVVYYPPRDLMFYQSDLNGNQLTRERMNCIKALMSGKKFTVVTTIDALMERIAGVELIASNIIDINSNDELDEKKFAEQLANCGYERTAQVEAQGQFAIRGGIVDIFPLTEDNPIRIELWGDEISSIRSFDVASQRSLEDMEKAEIYPASEIVLSEDEKDAGMEKIRLDFDKNYSELRKAMKTEEAHRLKSLVNAFSEEMDNFLQAANIISFANYFFDEMYSFLDFFIPDETAVFLDESIRLIEKAEAVFSEFSESMTARLSQGYILPGQSDILYSPDEIFHKISKCHSAAFSTISQKQDKYKAKAHLSIHVRSVNSYNGSFDSLLTDLRRFKKNNYKVILLSASTTRAKRLADNLAENEINAFFSENFDRELKDGEIMTANGNISAGFEYPGIRFAIISETDIFGSVRKKKKKKRHSYEGEHISSFTDLNVGDYVIHESYGLGVYQGIEHIEIDNVTRDYVKISYRDDSSVYVIASNLDVLQKYASKDAEKKPKLNRLGDKEWSRTKARVKSSVEGVARKLVELYAERQKAQGFAYGEDTVWQKEFEEMFPFEETDDQLMAIEAVKHDMESKKIMDRLICGDVGFGKTEVAIRAAFKAVQENKQVAFLVPTTILAEQHYHTLAERLKDYPVKVALLCRFRSAAENRKTIADLKKGMVDIVVGTHRLLSKDVVFKDLGLLVIDEEQRFGVTHKERIKEMRRNVDVIALSATPIPRTLHMSLVGIRDMSVLEEAPQERMPIQTFIMEYSAEMVREAIRREMSRGGQVYYVYNRVNDIADVAAGIEKLVPDANVAFAHGQMKERELEDIMSDFINGEIDVLVSTTIIETGIDIPNVNTMIISDADRMGLSQLYQLRGRVGRSNRTAYAFLLYKRDKMLKETAEKRLAAIREFTDLGSGFRIAMKDLEIRGAGNVLGAEQHGHMEAVGYDLYCKMLDLAVKHEKGEELQPEFDTTIDINEDAFLPNSYVKNESQKLELYRRIAAIDSEEEAQDMRDELKDRFGKLPKSVENLINVSLIRDMAHKVYIERLSARENTVMFEIYGEARLNPANIEPFLDKFDGALTFKAAGKPLFIYKKGKSEKDDFINISTKVLDEMKILLS
ncbi:transcription-repair coupling factor [Lachnospiraceae bacterium C1.1]|nr:transcription-repair coupling factor [Lachnospiraceae bacterium C1.1]